MKKIKMFILFNFCALISNAQQVNVFENEIRAFEKKDSLSFPAQGQILLYGSSTMRFWVTSEKDLAGYPTINRGFGGSQLSDAIYFFDRMVVPYQPKLILFYEGDNDLSSSKKSVETIYKDYLSFMKLVKKKCPNTKVAIYSLRPSLARENTMPDQQKLNELFKKYAKKHKKRAYFIDAYQALLDSTGRPNGANLVGDKLHLNAEGYKIWTKVTREFLDGDEK